MTQIILPTYIYHQNIIPTTYIDQNMIPTYIDQNTIPTYIDQNITAPNIDQIIVPTGPNNPTYLSYLLPLTEAENDHLHTYLPI